MSVVTDIILVTAIADGAKREGETLNADKLSAYLEREHSRNLVQVDKYAGGDKCMQCDVFMAAINFLDVEAFVLWFRSIEWSSPESTQLMIKEEWDEKFRFIRLGAEH